MRYLFAATAAALLSNAALADSFDFAGGHVVTHRGGPQNLPMGAYNLDKKNKMTCVSDKGCSIVIQTQVNGASQDTICTKVDGKDAQPPCTLTTGYAAATLQGVPNLAKGTHVVQTQITINEEAGLNIRGFQVVYTLYEHQ